MAQETRQLKFSAAIEKTPRISEMLKLETDGICRPSSLTRHPFQSLLRIGVLSTAMLLPLGTVNTVFANRSMPGSAYQFTHPLSRTTNPTVAKRPHKTTKVVQAPKQQTYQATTHKTEKKKTSKDNSDIWSVLLLIIAAIGISKYYSKEREKERKNKDIEEGKLIEGEREEQDAYMKLHGQQKIDTRHALLNRYLTADHKPLYWDDALADEMKNKKSPLRKQIKSYYLNSLDNAKCTLPLPSSVSRSFTLTEQQKYFTKLLENLKKDKTITAVPSSIFPLLGPKYNEECQAWAAWNSYLTKTFAVPDKAFKYLGPKKKIQYDTHMRELERYRQNMEKSKPPGFLDAISHHNQGPSGIDDIRG